MRAGWGNPARARVTMLVLGVETSCDETALALADESGIVASVMASQVDVHALFGGVVPELASREHGRLIGPLWDELWARAGGRVPDYVAVTRGPGLLGSLLVGLAFAKGLALAWQRPLIGVNHLHAHLLAAGLEHKLVFPALGVLVSGGHTHLYRMESPWDMEVLGRTLDDAAGEACDKFAAMAGLPYPGGALLDALGKRGQANAVLFPRPYTKNETLDFSFSGLKTAGATWLREHPDARFPLGEAPARARLDEAPQALCDAAASYLAAVADTLRIKAERALNLFDARAVALAGGVAANSVVRAVFQDMAKARGLPLLVPSPALCTDNGAMVAHAGFLLARAGWRHGLDVGAVPRGQPIPSDMRRAGPVEPLEQARGHVSLP